MTGFHVLFVCTGNMYRSPIAERLLALHLGAPAGPIGIGSAGTHARPGEPMNSATAAVIEELGGFAGGFAARRLTAADVLAADLVLGLAREHREAAVRLRPAALRRCFTLEEFVRLTDGPQRMTGPLDAVGRAAATRGRSPAAAPDHEDIPDPDGRPLEELRSCAARVDLAIRRVAAVLTSRQEVLPA